MELCFFLKEKNSCVPVSQGRQSLFTPLRDPGLTRETALESGPTVRSFGA